jgi:hypothetical protein
MYPRYRLLQKKVLVSKMQNVPGPFLARTYQPISFWFRMKKTSSKYLWYFIIISFDKLYFRINQDFWLCHFLYPAYFLIPIKIASFLACISILYRKLNCKIITCHPKDDYGNYTKNYNYCPISTIIWWWGLTNSINELLPIIT